MGGIDPKIAELVQKELGKKSADLFVNFYSDFSTKDQVRGLREILVVVVGHERANYLLKQIDENS